MPHMMKDSGIQWLGEIPDTWECKSMKRLGKVSKVLIDPSKSKDELFCEYSMPAFDSGMQPQMVLGSTMESTRIALTESTLLVNKLNVRKQRIWNIVDPIPNSVCSTEFVPFQITEADPKFVYYSLMNEVLTQYLVLSSTGTTNSQRRVSPDLICSLKIALPSLDEQRRIVSYLDTQCAHIDAVIEKTRVSIEEYKKLKQSIITQAVTKGVRRDVKLKSIDNPWFPELPEELKISRVGMHYDIILGKMLCSDKKSDDMEEYPYYCAANVHFDGVDSTNLKKMWFTPSEIKMYEVHDGDLLVVEGGAGAGGCAIAGTTEDIVGVQNSIQIVRPKKDHDVRYLCYLIQSLVKRQYIDVVCNKATIPHFTKDKLATVPYPVWPVSDQTAIADYLDRECSRIDDLVIKKNHFIDELENYKKSLIYEYVTGKKEVPVDA